MSYRDLIWLLSLRISLDLFDSVEMLEVVLEENIVHHNISKELEVALEEIIVHHDIPRCFESAIVSFACISFILSPLQLMQVKTNHYGEWKYRKIMSCAQRSAQTLLVNCVFLSLRLALFLKYGKNGIIILLSLFEICSRFECCGCEERYYIGSLTSTEERTSSENETSRFCNHFSIIQSHCALKMCSNYPVIKLEPALGTLEDKIEHLSSFAHVVHTTAKQAISRHRTENENVFKLSKDENCKSKACKKNFHCQICKFPGFLLPSSSWFLKLPIRYLKTAFLSAGSLD